VLVFAHSHFKRPFFLSHRNFLWVTKVSKSKTKRRLKKKKVAEAVPRTSMEDRGVTKVNSYVTNMLVVSLGMKLADAIRRTCMYTKSSDTNKGFYAICRGVFPIHELCGTATALALARRDVLGQSMPLWKLLLPSAIFHGMANFRGMKVRQFVAKRNPLKVFVHIILISIFFLLKPIFKWNAATPWSEMQLSTNVPGDSILAQLVAKPFPKIMWLIILFRVLGYCVKNYYLINRQAVKRTTTYAGKHAAFSAELAATEMLQKFKER
jgi:hypothetical protein